MGLPTRFFFWLSLVPLFGLHIFCAVWQGDTRPVCHKPAGGAKFLLKAEDENRGTNNLKFSARTLSALFRLCFTPTKPQELSKAGAHDAALCRRVAKKLEKLEKEANGMPLASLVASAEREELGGFFNVFLVRSV